jgi:SagB-type dehydrogenase family enzyme
MDERSVGRRFGFLCSQIDDPRRIELRQARFIEGYRRRSTDDDIIEVCHQLTKLRRADDADMAEALALFQQPHMHSIQYVQDQEYPLQRPIRLPEPTIPDELFPELVQRRRSCRAFARRPITLAQLSALLFSALGETERLNAGGEDDHPVIVSLRSIPSGGALHPTRIFAVVLHPGDLDQGIYHYDAPRHSLEFVKPLLGPEIQTLFAAFPIHPAVVNLAETSAIFFITTKFWRARAKYGPRGYRYCLQEAGSACQNLSLTSVALGLGHIVLGGFYDDEVHACLEIDGVDHAVITAIAVGMQSPQAQVDLHDAEL